MTSSTGIVPTRRCWLVHHRHGDEVVLRHEPRHVLPVHLGRHAHHVLVPHGEDGLPGLGDEEPAQRDDADQMPVIVHHVQLERALLGDRLAHVVDRLLHRRALVHGDEVRRHEAAGGVLRILEDLLDLLGLLLLHEVQDLLGVLARQLLHDVGRLLGRHLVEDARDLHLVERAHQFELRVVVELGEHIAGALLRERAEDCDLIGQGELSEHAGDVGRVGFLEQRPFALIRGPLGDASGGFEQAVRLVHRVPSRALYRPRPRRRRSSAPCLGSTPGRARLARRDPS